MSQLAVAFHLDLLNDDDAPPVRDLAALDTTEFELIGLPLIFGTRRGAEAAGLGLEAGLHADYAVDLSDQLTLALSGIVSKTGYLDNSWANNQTRANASLRFHDNGLRLAFEPSWRINMVETTVTERDFGAGLRLERDLADSISLTAGFRYQGHDTTGDQDGYTRAETFSTLSYRFSPHAKIDLRFKATYTLSQDDSSGMPGFQDLRYAASDIRPSLAMSIPILDTIDFTAAYRYCRSTDERPRAADDIHGLDIAAAFYSNDPIFANIDLTAAYGLERTSSTAHGSDEAAHSATIAFAMPF